MLKSIFISYSHTDHDAVNRISSDLSSFGYDVWIDKALEGGNDWWGLIIDNIYKRDIFIYVLSSESLESTACRREFEYADALNKAIIPVQVDKNISVHRLTPALSKKQIIDYYNSDKEDALCLIKACLNILTKKLPDILPEPPEIPISYLGEITHQVQSDSILSQEKQTYLFREIERYLSQSENNNKDVLSLLIKFRHRRDSYTYTTDDIDVLINKLYKKDGSTISKRNINEVIQENFNLKKEIESSHDTEPEDIKNSDNNGNIKYRLFNYNENTNYSATDYYMFGKGSDNSKYIDKAIEFYKKSTSMGHSQAKKRLIELTSDDMYSP